MRAKYIDLTRSYDESIFEEIGQAIRDGKLVVFPTETVYGIGTNGLDGLACQKIFEAKGRSSDNPLILHICDKNMLDEITIQRSYVENQLIHTFFPGPFTLILNRSAKVPQAVTAGLDTVAVRMPSHPIAQKIIQASGVPIAAPSANISGKPSGTIISDILAELGDKVDYIVDGGACDIGLESTVVKVMEEIPCILRPGAVTKEQLINTVGNATIDPHLFTDCSDLDAVPSPGMKHRHYAPNTNCVLVYGSKNQKVINTIQELATHYSNPLILCLCENKKQYTSFTNVITIGSVHDLAQISHSIFSILRKIDSYQADIALIEGVKPEGIGLAIMNRLMRACEYHFIHVDEKKEGENNEILE